jgi:hypothetical protein
VSAVLEQIVFGDAVVAVEGLSSREWLQAADVIVGRHRTRRAARRWATATRRRYPGCVLTVSRHRRGRWFVVGASEHIAVLVEVRS